MKVKTLRKTCVEYIVKNSEIYKDVKKLPAELQEEIADAKQKEEYEKNKRNRYPSTLGAHGY